MQVSENSPGPQVWTPDGEEGKQKGRRVYKGFCDPERQRCMLSRKARVYMQKVVIEKGTHVYAGYYIQKGRSV